ncbi:hypothetical protein ACQBAT_14535 [Ornithinimicrobium sp. Y1847]|uniref:hypothetical protein n=1 Tax=Ornithinimicrobium sp. Y1847 TaxID=3405419 RepID=UPI003B67E664
MSDGDGAQEAVAGIGGTQPPPDTARPPAELQQGLALRAIPVRTRSQVRQFLELPTWDERRDTHAVPLWHSTIRSWWRGTGPHRAHGPVELYLVLDRAERVRGRTTLHTDTRMDATLGEPTLLLGATEFADRAALAAIVEHALAVARQRGRTRLLGPVSLLPNQVGGVITDGFEEPGFVDGPWNPEHVPQDWEALGFERMWTGATWRVDDLRGLEPHEIFPVDDLPEGVVLRRGSRRQLAEQLPVLREMLNAAFAELGYYTPIEADELAAATDGLAHLLDERLLLWLERGAGAGRGESVPLAFVLVIPDLTEFVRSTGGRLSPVDMVRLLATRGRYREDAVLIIKGTVPGARGQGLMRHLSHELLAGLRAGGYRRLSVTFIEDDNAGSQAQFVAMGGRPLHRTCFYSRAVEPAGFASLAEQVSARSVSWGRAPSAHNTQPWRVQVLDDRALQVGWHEDRELPVADPTRRDLFLSLGALVLSLRVVAEDLGIVATVAWDVELPTRRAAVVALQPRVSAAAPPRPTWSLGDLLARRTVRAPFLTAPTAAEVAALASAAALPGGVDLVVLPDELVDEHEVAAAAYTLTGPGAEELASWLRLDRSHPRYDLDGLSAEALGLSRPEARGLRLLTRSAGLRGGLRLTRADRLLARSSVVSPRGTVVALIARPGLSLERIGQLGEHLMSAWLAGTREGWSAHPLSELVDHAPSAAALNGWVTGTAGRPSQVYSVWRWGSPIDRSDENGGAELSVDFPMSPRLTD